MITIRQFEGWCKKAYPDIRLAELTDGSKIASTKDKFNDFTHNVRAIDLHYYETENKFVFEGLNRKPTVFPTDESSDSLLLSFCRHLWGEPKVAFVPVKQKTENPKPKEEKKQEEQKPKPSTAPQPKREIKKETDERKQIIANLSGVFKDRIVFNKLFNGAVEVIVGENSGPILYDYGISPDKKPTHLFIPYNKKEQVNSLINNFINKIKSN